MRSKSLAAATLAAALVAACSSTTGTATTGTTATTPVADATGGTSAAGAGTTAPPGTAVGAPVSLDGGQVLLPAADVGDVDLTTLPLGSGKISTTGPAVGTIYQCHRVNSSAAPAGGGTATWVHGTTFDLTAKLWVAGNVTWPGATFSATVSGGTRTLAGNDLPVDAHTGTFPVTSSDPAYVYKPNPSTISTMNSFSLELPAGPTLGATPTCVGGEVGVLTNGIPLFSAVDANSDDAIAEEVWDTCWGHPNDAAYHYHAVSSCIPDPGTGHSTLLGYAFDGFGIYGHRGEGGHVVRTADLDECHGHTHEVDFNGAEVTMYHYHATWDFPYTVSCFRGTSAIEGSLFAPAR